jgi:hypothetical protein
MDDDLPGKNNDKLIRERWMTTYLVRTTTYLFSERRMTIYQLGTMTYSFSERRMTTYLMGTTDILIQREADDCKNDGIPVLTQRETNDDLPNGINPTYLFSERR